jgi:antitoxin CptB
VAETLDESRETRLKRLRIRSWRRGTREMDLILGPFADGPLAALDDPALDAYEALLEQADPDLYAWICGAALPAEDGGLRETVERLRRFHGIGHRIG